MPAEASSEVSARSTQKVFLYGLGYFGCYLPYAAITKALTDPSLTGDGAVSGLTLVPLATAASAVGMALFIFGTGLYRHTVPEGSRWPRLRWGAVLSGLATAVVIVTTTLSYTFAASSVPFVMVLMRGGVLALAPVVDLITGRAIPTYAWLALGLSGTAIAVVTMGEGGGGEVSLGLGVVVGLYLLAYLVRLMAMSRMAKTQAEHAAHRFFVEEQLVATPAALLGLGLLAWILPGAPAHQLREGFALALPHPAWTVLVGILSQGTGIFGALVLLDARGHASSVPINRAASIVAGLGAALALAAIYGSSPPTVREWVACGLLAAAVWAVYWFSHAKVAPKAP